MTGEDPLILQPNYGSLASHPFAYDVGGLGSFASRANPSSGATVIIHTHMPFPDEIQTERLLLRPPTEEDAERMFARYCQDADVCRYMSWQPHKSIDDSLVFVRKTIADNAADLVAVRLIFSRASGELLGSVGGAFQSHRVQFGYCLARDAWGHGFATEAARAFVAEIMTDPRVWRMQAYCDVENVASARVLEKAGLSFEGTLRRYLVLPNLGDEPRDVLCYAKVCE